MAPPALPRAFTVLLLVPLLLASTARSDEEAPSPTAEPPASAPLPATAADVSELAHSPISHPPTADASAPAPSAAADTTADGPSPPPPAPPKTSPVASPSSDSDTPAPAPSHSSLAPAHPPAADKYKGNEDEDDDGDSSKAPAPAPAADQIKAANATAGSIAPEEEERRELNGGGKAGVVLGTFAAAAVLGLGCFVWRKRRANIRRARYADYAARLELV